MALVVVPTGVKKAVEALTATAIMKGSGEIFKEVAARMTIGAINMAVAELLINRGARVNVRNKLGATPLNVASDPEMQQLLKKHGGKR